MSSLELASQLQHYAGLRTFGLSLEGDIQLDQGRKDAAKRAYAEAASIRLSPSIERRLPLTMGDKNVPKKVTHSPSSVRGGS